ncbi:MAG TPA: DUF2255 family protein [Candidatus Limnocylindrales bacterium]|nr:DUF2255 family protein [Candidatus Limnocylindrales bacterium]
MTDRLPDDVLAQLRDVQDVEIETRPAPDVPGHRTTIWVVVDDQGRAFIRTYRGPASRWYREATSNESVGIIVDGQRVEVGLEPAADPERVEACSVALQQKYAHAGGLRGMLADENLPTTLELHPVGSS